MSNTIVSCEKQIIYFLLKDKKFLESIIDQQSVTENVFNDPINKKLVEIIRDYYQSYKSLLVEDEMVKIINDLYASKKIDDSESAGLTALFEDLTNPDIYFFEDEQFERVYETWVESSLVPKATEIIKKSIPTLNDNLGLKAIQDIMNGFEKLLVFKTVDEHFDSMDISKDIDFQIEDVVNRREHPEDFRGIPTGIEKLDQQHNGFEKGTLTLIGGITGSGKSTLMMNISKNIFDDLDKNVLIISLEMSKQQWARKYNSLDTGLDSSALLRGNKSVITDSHLTFFMNKLQERRDKKRNGAYIVDTFHAQTQTWSQIISTIEKKHETFKPDIIFVDQLSLIKLNTHGGQIKTNDALGLLTKEIRAYAQIHQVPIVVAVQANRASIVRTKDGKREIHIDVENVEDSHKVVSDADCFLAVNPVEEDADFRVLLKIVKQREGPKASIELKAKLNRCAIFDANSERGKAIDEWCKSDEEKAEIDNRTAADEIGDTGLTDATNDAKEGELDLSDIDYITAANDMSAEDDLGLDGKTISDEDIMVVAEKTVTTEDDNAVETGSEANKRIRSGEKPSNKEIRDMIIKDVEIEKNYEWNS